jgi:spoIIIJ-associated protein
MSAYREFTGKSVEEALKSAREAFGIGLEELDFEILTPGSRGVLGMGAEPARIVAAPRSELGGAAPKREAAESQPLPPRPPRDDRPAGGFGDRDRGGDRGGDRGRDRGGDRGPRRDDRPRPGFGDQGSDRGPDRGVTLPPQGDVRPPQAAPQDGVPVMGEADRGEGAPPLRDDRGPRRDDRGPRRDDRPRGGFGDRDRGDRGPDRGPDRGADRPPRAAQSSDLSASEAAEVTAARGSLSAERADLEASEASPEALAAGQAILEELMRLMDLQVTVEVQTGDTSRLNVVGEGEAKEALGALIGRKGERLSALQHLVNLMLSKKMGDWTRVLVDVEDYRGRRERQLRDLATRAAERVAETGKMLQLEPMPALERRWVHIALRDHPNVATQSIGEEPNRRIVVLPRNN